MIPINHFPEKADLQKIKYNFFFFEKAGLAGIKYENVLADE